MAIIKNWFVVDLLCSSCRLFERKQHGVERRAGLERRGEADGTVHGTLPGRLQGRSCFVAFPQGVIFQICAIFSSR